MPDGEMRRPPQLWEQRLARTTAILGAGISSSGDATAIVPPTPVPGEGGGIEPAPVLPAPGAFIAPSAPTLIGSVQGINVVWNGLNSDGDLWPSDTSWVEVHMSTAGTGFTPGTATLKGRLARPGGLAVTGLTAATTYYFKLRGADPAGNYTTPSAATAGSAGLINAPDIAANAITANSIVAGTITGWSINSAFLSGGTVSGGVITGGTINGAVITSTTVSGYATSTDIANFITGGQVNGNVTSISGGVITTGTVAAARIDVANLTVEKLTSGPFSTRRVVIGEVGSTDAVQFKKASTSDGWILAHNFSGDGLSLSRTHGGGTSGNFQIVAPVEGQSFRPESNTIVFQGYRTTTTAGDVMLRLDSNVTTTAQAKFQVEADGDVLSRTNSYAGYSDRRLKENIEPARDYLDDLRQVEVVNFNWIGSDQKLLGVIAQQIQPIFPNMVAEDQDGTLSVRYSVFVPMLLTAVQSLADKVDELTARIEALEA